MQTTVDRSHLLARVREGMTVLDVDGEQVGKVKAMKMGDPEAATTQGNEPPTGVGLVGPGAGLANPGGVLPAGMTEPDVPEPRRSHLLRVGYMRVSGDGPLAEDRYVAADEIGDVAGDTVRMAPPPAEQPVSVRQPVTSTGSPMASPYRPIEEPRSGLPWWSGALFASSGVALVGAGAWAFRRWQHERNRPVNRLRRRARKLTQRLPEPAMLRDQLPEMDEQTRGLGAAALAGLAAGWLLRERTRPASPEEQADDLANAASDAAPMLNTQLLQIASLGRDRGADLMTGVRPWMAAAGVAGIGLLILARRLMRPNAGAMYIGTPGVESAIGRDRTRTGELDPYLGREQPRVP